MQPEKPYVSDIELLRSIREGSIPAFKQLYDKYWEALYLRACKRVGQDDAKDLVQEVMTTLWQRRNFIYADDSGEIGRYLSTALKYRIISHFADKAVDIKHTAFFDMAQEDVSQKMLESKELKELIENEINQLPFRMQQVFRMSREYDLSISQIAKRLNLSDQTVKNQLTEALKRLRIALRSQTKNENELIFVVFLSCYYFCN